MARFRDVDRALFPVKNIGSIVQIFKNQLENNTEPDLALLSIIVGAVENTLTCSRSNDKLIVDEPFCLPALELQSVETLYAKFHSIIKGSIDLKQHTSKYATRDLIKKVSDVIWNSLSRSYYKDKAHLQSLYSYLTGNKLDCFGVAFAVVAGCQVLGFYDVHLALSEDHAWVVFGELGADTAEVTWHGKGSEDKRGQAIGPGISSRSWLYVNNRPVVCTRAMEVAALVSAINPSLNATNDAFEVAMLQQELLWLLYDLGHLKRYPMAIGNLGDLEEISNTPGRPPCATLFKEAIYSARTNYYNQHVYPYTYQGGYFYRNKMYKEAFNSWANASDVIRQYNYSRDDEEIYKEFLEIANELIPHIIKVESSGHSARSILKDPFCFAHLLRFYDGICQWEEGSATPVLHIGWAKPLVNTISKFEAEVRAQVEIVSEEQQRRRVEVASAVRKSSKEEANGANKCYNNNNYCTAATAHDAQHDQLIKEIESKVNGEQSTPHLHPSIVALTAACSEKILNPKYLLQGGGSPFVGTEPPELPKNGNTGNGLNPGTSSTTNQIQPTTNPDTNLEDDNKSRETIKIKEKEKIVEEEEEVKKDDVAEVEPSKPVVILRSQKMRGLKDLLLAEKLNTQAIQLQLTAQSQVQIGKKGRGDTDGVGIRPKRTRRE